MTERELIALCRYYKGEEECPYEDRDKYVKDEEMWWFYEKCWVRFQQQAAYSDFAIYVSEYISVGLEFFEMNDGVPISLKALLFNRWSKGSWSLAEGVPSFKRAYIDLYKGGSAL